MPAGKGAALLMAIGYIKTDNVVNYEEYTERDVSVTNQEVMSMFRNEISGIFGNGNKILPVPSRVILEAQTVKIRPPA